MLPLLRQMFMIATLFITPLRRADAADTSTRLPPARHAFSDTLLLLRLICYAAADTLPFLSSPCFHSARATRLPLLMFDMMPAPPL